ncbi:MAG TPA: 4'-phosphopantetheinyl transferase superfamily protein [Candidatus Babeliales bacterium]|nr:4'-phosphopantetheinyl transferase superfamily protein [Candidatus Babeliales bacterium]
MILGIGIDSAEIERFLDWDKFTHRQLLKFFSQREIDYCTSIPAKSAERFAARFAAKEALYKALSNLRPQKPFLLLTVAKKCEIYQETDTAPSMRIDWTFFISTFFPHLKTAPIAHLSITHTRAIATVCIILESKSDYLLTKNKKSVLLPVQKRISIRYCK